MIIVDSHEIRTYGKREIIAEDLKDLVHDLADSLLLYMATMVEMELHNRHVEELQDLSKEATRLEIEKRAKGQSNIVKGEEEDTDAENDPCN